ncbi:prolipoprotein diacylglyceryl transferase [Candidatus Soleaferrea massiliensis]|uniref:prolipoprotein diacylglyceryl transferase n=1 Tax=Candidatus Soleaferrea massiliensis TaxID=1470354 RepID=UPI0006934DFE|nr:prolipoprotein diacylglyceryl transferase family protein [Candidatus Soleaferrea massiliensis]
MFPSFNIYGRDIGTYAIMATIGMLLSGLIAFILGKKYKICFEDIVLIMVTMGMGMLIGGHLMYGMTNIENLIELFKHISQYDAKQFLYQLGQYFGGMVYYGGFIGAAIGVCIHSKYSKSLKTGEILDIFAVSVPLFHTFGRVGCFLGGCCYGMESDWGFIVYNNTLQPDINGVVRIPIQLIEALCNLCIFFVLLVLFSKRRQKGCLLYIYMIIYSAVRFVLEFYRGDVIRGFIGGLSTSQWISIVLLIFAVWKLISKYFRLKHCVEAGRLKQ